VPGTGGDYHRGRVSGPTLDVRAAGQQGPHRIQIAGGARLGKRFGGHDDAATIWALLAGKACTRLTVQKQSNDYLLAIDIACRS
jgi:hypothetical protein